MKHSEASERRPICVSVINMKGGVGKTKTAALLGRYYANKDLRVLVVDLDPQANLSQAYMGNAYVKFLESDQPSIVEIFNGYRPIRSIPRTPSGMSTQMTYFRTSRLDLISLIVSLAQLNPTRRFWHAILQTIFKR